MTIAHAVVLTAVFVALLCLPCVVVVLLRDDNSPVRPASPARTPHGRRANERGILGTPAGPKELLRRAARAAATPLTGARGANTPRQAVRPVRRAARNAAGFGARRTRAPAQSPPDEPRVVVSPAPRVPRRPAAQPEIFERKAAMNGKLAPAQRGREADQLAGLDHDLREADLEAILATLPDPPIEQLAGELRHLDQRRRGGTHGSRVWHDSVLRAYDVRLCLACRCLDIDQHLEPLEGLDRELERIRMESELEAAGFSFH